MRLAWITPKWPLPADDGARRATASILSALSSQGIHIDLLSFGPHSVKSQLEQAKKELGVSSAVVIPLDISRYRGVGRLVQLITKFPKSLRFPLTALPFIDASAVKELESALNALATDTDLVVYDGLHPAAHLYTSSSLCGFNYIYRAHNCETQIWQRRAAEERNLLLKLLLKIQSGLMQNFERHICQNSAGVAAVSKDDLKSLSAFSKIQHSCVVSIGCSFKNPLPLENANRILFLGKLDWPPNRDGLRWFLDKVWPAVRERRPDLELDIVGSGDGGWLDSFKELSGVSIHGRVDDLIPHYKKACASLVPVFYGSGTRVKAIEAASFGRVCLSTEIGVEGLNLVAGQHYLQAENEDQWIEQLVHLEAESAKEKGVAAFNRLKVEFDEASAATKFAEFASKL